jgi:hypothetical protein
MYVDTLTDGSTDNLGRIVLRAMNTTTAVAQVIFLDGASSFNKGITVQAGAGVILSESLTTKNLPTIIQTGTGTLTVTTTKSLQTTSQHLTVTADDVDYWGYVDSSLAAQEINCFTPGRELGIVVVGHPFKPFDLSGQDFAYLISDGLVVGNSNCGDLTVDGIVEAASQNIANVITLLANRDNTKVTFFGSISTFNTLVVQADNGINIDASVLTDEGSILLDGDLENSSTADTPNAIIFSNGKTVTSKTLLTLETTNGQTVHLGDATFEAGTGIVIHNQVSGGNIGKTLTINSDYDARASYTQNTATVVNGESDGTLTVRTDKNINSNNCDVMITA